MNSEKSIPARKGRRALSWILAIGVAGALAVGVAASVGGAKAAANADDDLAAARDRVAAALEAVADAEKLLEGARSDAAVAEEESQTADDALARARSARSEAEAAVPVAEEAALDLLAAAAEAVDAAATGPAALQPIVEGRAELLSAARAGDYEGFHEIQVDFNAACEAANAWLEALDAVYVAPALATAAAGGPLGTYPLSELTIDPPTGPAEVTATLPDDIPCKATGNAGCEYRVAVTFTGANTLEATVDRMATRWIERGGNSWWVSTDGEWQDAELVIPADGSVTHSFWIWTDADDKMRRIMGGKLRFGYSGIDAEGNKFRGTLYARLERPD